MHKNQSAKKKLVMQKGFIVQITYQQLGRMRQMVSHHWGTESARKWNGWCDHPHGIWGLESDWWLCWYHLKRVEKFWILKQINFWILGTILLRIKYQKEHCVVVMWFYYSTIKNITIQFTEDFFTKSIDIEEIWFYL